MMEEARERRPALYKKNKFIFSWTNEGQNRNENFDKTLYNNKLSNLTNSRIGTATMAMYCATAAQVAYIDC